MRYAFLRTYEFHAARTDLPRWIHQHATRSAARRPAGTPVRTPLGTLTLDEYVQRGPVNGAIVLEHGAIVYERYPRMRRVASTC